MIGSVLASKLCSMLVLCGLSRQYSNVSMRTRNLLTKAGVLGSVSMAFGSMLWSHKKTEPTQTDSGSAPSCKEPHFPYELKLVQVLFRHGARTPLKSIPGIMEVRDHLCHTRTNIWQTWCSVSQDLKLRESHLSYLHMPCLGDEAMFTSIWKSNLFPCPVCIRPSGCLTSWNPQHTHRSTMWWQTWKEVHGPPHRWRTATGPTYWPWVCLCLLTSRGSSA